MPDGQVDVPVMGNVKKEWVYAGLALLVGVVGYAYFRRRAGTAPSVDVGSGQSDAFQGAQLPAGSYDAYGSLIGQGAATQPDSWGLQAINYLSTVFGYDRQTAFVAITKYLNGEELSKAEAQLVNGARGIIGNSPDNLPVRISTATPTTPTTPDTPTNPVADLWDTWQANQIASGQYKADPNGGLDWGVVARNTFGTSATPTKNEVFQRALALQSSNPDAARRYTTYVPMNVIPSLRY